MFIAIGTFVCWIFKRQIDRVDKVVSDLDKHKLHVTKTHVTHASLEETKDNLYKRWDKLEAELDDTTKTANLAVSRNELDIVHGRVNDIEIRKQDKKLTPIV